MLEKDGPEHRAVKEYMVMFFMRTPTFKNDSVGAMFAAQRVADIALEIVNEAKKAEA